MDVTHWHKSFNATITYSKIELGNRSKGVASDQRTFIVKETILNDPNHTREYEVFHLPEEGVTTEMDPPVPLGLPLQDHVVEAEVIHAAKAAEWARWCLEQATRNR